MADEPDRDIEALVLLVLMNAAQDAQDDLKAILAETRALNEKKSRLRELLDTLAREDEKLAERLRCEYADLFVSTAEGDELEALELQNALDRRSKFLSTLSNILEKLSETESSIVQNLK